MNRGIIILVGWFCSASLLSQSLDDAYVWASEIVESLSEEGDDQDYSYLIEDIVQIYNNPININQATRQELERIIFLNGLQIENLLFHRYVNGPFGSIYELQAIEGFNQRLLEWLEPLVVFEVEETRARAFRPRGDVFLRTRFTVETPEGYKPKGENPPAFKGNKYLLYSRYEMALTRTMEVGFVAESDPGEPMFKSNVTALDYMSGYVSWKPNKFLKQMIIGQYRISGGQGLVLQSGMNARKSSLTTSIRNRNNTYRPSLSVNETAGLSGLLLAFGGNNYSVTPFISIRKRDGNLLVTEDGTIITSLRTDGYHRTQTELNARKNTQEDVFGVQVKYFFKRFTLEAGHMQYRLEYPLEPTLQPYNRYYFRGRQTHNTWLALEGSVGRSYIFSEMAFNNTLHPALWAGMLFSPGANVSMVASYRRIPVDFNAPLGAAFTESSRGAGESGFYSGMQLDLPARITLSAYVDYFRFNWLQYQLKSPSNGYDVLAMLVHKPNRLWENTLRYRYREKWVNLTSDGPAFPVGLRIQNQLRFQTRFAPSKEWSFTTRCDVHKVSIPGKSIPTGLYLGQEMRYNHPGNKWNFVTRYGVIDAEDYETRVYVYEPDVLYSFTTPAYYGQGSRWIVMSKFTLVKNLDFWARYGWWHYTNRETISSGNTLINSNVLREFRFQLRKKF